MYLLEYEIRNKNRLCESIVNEFVDITDHIFYILVNLKKNISMHKNLRYSYKFMTYTKGYTVSCSI